MKETRLINRFSEKKILIWGNGPFWAQKLCIITLDLPEEFFENLPNEEGINGINGINNFPEKKNWGKWTILGPKMVHPHNSGSTVRIF